jgi:hypothetical protein
MDLASRSVAVHMRLLTGISPDRQILYMYMPSEWILVLGAADILYGLDTSWSPILDTFNKRLCESRLIEKGLICELAAQILLLIACDFAAPGMLPAKKGHLKARPSSSLL